MYWRMVYITLVIALSLSDVMIIFCTYCRLRILCHILITVCFNVGDKIFWFWRLIPCLLMHWLLKSPEHQQAWYWLCRTDNIYCCSRVNFIYWGQTNSKIQIKMWISFIIYKTIQHVKLEFVVVLFYWQDKCVFHSLFVFSNFVTVAYFFLTSSCHCPDAQSTLHSQAFWKLSWDGDHQNSGSEN